MDINQVIARPEYNFLREESVLGDNVCLLTFTGSIGSGVSTPDSDIDLRGFYIRSADDILGRDDYVNGYRKNDTDTTVYTLERLVYLLINGNPMALELLAVDIPDNHIIMNDIGKWLRGKSSIFIAKESYRGYHNYIKSMLEEYNRRLRINMSMDLNPDPTTKKLAYLIIRYTLTLRHLMETGDVRMSHPDYTDIMAAIRSGDVYTVQQVNDLIESLTKVTNNSVNDSKLQSNINKDVAINFLREVNHRTVLTWRAGHANDTTK